MSQLSIMLNTDMYMGDHGETRLIACEYIEGETVEALVARLGETHGGYAVNGPRLLGKWDVVEIRIVAGESQ